MFRILLLFLIILFVVGCAVSSKVYLPSGEQGYSITCKGTALTWGDCYQEAGRLCGYRGYEVIAKSNDRDTSVIANKYGLYSGSSEQRNMLIKCR